MMPYDRKRREREQTSITTPPDGLPSHCIGISNLAAGCEPTRCAGTQDTMRVGGLQSAGHGASRDCKIETTFPVSERAPAHELKCCATTTAFSTVRLKMRILRQPNWLIA